MFEVIICTVNTGRIVHKLFDTREEAGRHIAQWEEQVLTRSKRRGGGTLRDYRVEVRYREDLALRPVRRPIPVAA